MLAIVLIAIIYDFINWRVVQISWKIDIPIIVRLQGTNAEEGAKIIDESGLKVTSAVLLKDAAKKVKEALS